tara:strand:+ start:68 stop:241 length:174 start_codon:yes stop_codon:yes gene_type:complete
MLERLSQEQFEHIINLLIMYNSMTPPDKEVYLTEKSIMEAYNYMNNEGKELAKKLNI